MPLEGCDVFVLRTRILRVLLLKAIRWHKLPQTEFTQSFDMVYVRTWCVLEKKKVLVTCRNLESGCRICSYTNLGFEIGGF